ncbi:hypothetical protein CEXT_231291 [Caerostris extrusa]|uniref:Ribosomal protein S3 n=1 Tax=Caerostris extrusa TaxID=172846 RepID=A0AAV4MT20_CAEEX|nr:hypothetical protein CEXT_231291 [Caerostris extrusa]
MARKGSWRENVWPAPRGKWVRFMQGSKTWAIPFNKGILRRAENPFNLQLQMLLSKRRLCTKVSKGMVPQEEHNFQVTGINYNLRYSGRAISQKSLELSPTFTL